MVRARVMHAAISTMFDGAVHYGEAIIADETGAVTIIAPNTETDILGVFKELKIGKVCTYEYLLFVILIT